MKIESVDKLKIAIILLVLNVFAVYEYRAMLWLREHADKAFLCASDRYFLLAEGTYDIKHKQNYQFFTIMVTLNANFI